MYELVISHPILEGRADRGSGPLRRPPSLVQRGEPLADSPHLLAHDLDIRRPRILPEIPFPVRDPPVEVAELDQH